MARNRRKLINIAKLKIRYCVPESIASWGFLPKWKVDHWWFFQIVGLLVSGFDLSLQDKTASCLSPSLHPEELLEQIPEDYERLQCSGKRLLRGGILADSCFEFRCKLWVNANYFSKVMAADSRVSVVPLDSWRYESLPYCFSRRLLIISSRMLFPQSLPFPIQAERFPRFSQLTALLWSSFRASWQVTYCARSSLGSPGKNFRDCFYCQAGFCLLTQGIPLSFGSQSQCLGPFCHSIYYCCMRRNRFLEPFSPSGRQPFWLSFL